MISFLRMVRESGLGDLFQAGSDLANLGVLGLLGVAVLVLGWLHIRAYAREVRRADAATAMAATLSAQFDRALDLLERWSNRKRSGDPR